MLKQHIQVDEAKATLREMGYTLRVRREHGCRIGSVTALRKGRQAPEPIYPLSRPSPEVLQNHGPLVEWIRVHAVVDGCHVIVI